MPLWAGVGIDSDCSMLEVEDLRARLAAIKPAIRSVVEMKVFEGLEEIAPKLGCSVVTASPLAVRPSLVREKWELTAAAG